MRMTRARRLILILLAIALIAGAFSRPPSNPPLAIGGYRVLAADFHVHPGFFAAGAVAPWDLGMLARRQKLDVLGVTPHNEIYTAWIARWFSRVTGGPVIIPGEEVRPGPYHMIAIGIHERIAPRGTAAAVIDEIHAQGGVAIAAHPFPEFWPAFDAEAMKRLDGSEVMHTAVYRNAGAPPAYLEFYRKKKMTAIGSSDYHGLGVLGMCRTFVFARSGSEADIVEALKAGRTVVYDLNGSAYGDPELISLAARDGRIQDHATPPEESGFAVWISRLCAIAALLGIPLFFFSMPDAGKDGSQDAL